MLSGGYAWKFRDVDVEEESITTDPCGRPFLGLRYLLRLPLQVVRVK